MSDYNLDREIEEGLARAERMIRRQRLVWGLGIAGALVFLAFLVLLGAAIYWLGASRTQPVIVEEKMVVVTATVLPITAIPTATRTPAATPTPNATATPFGGGSGRIAFSSNSDGNCRLYAMNADGSGQTQLVESDGWRGALLSPNGQKIAFISQLDGEADTEIYVMNTDGSSKTRLTNNDSADFILNWSPDSLKVVFKSATDVSIINIDGSGLTTHNINGFLDEEFGRVTWSPDGGRIAYATNNGLFVDSIQRWYWNDRLTYASRYTYPVWSPDGEKLAFVSHNEIVVINADGTNYKIPVNHVLLFIRLPGHQTVKK